MYSTCHNVWIVVVKDALLYFALRILQYLATYYNTQYCIVNFPVQCLATTAT